jgi:putative ABC transport system permease protein
MNIIRKLWKKKITYTDTIGLLINNVTTIVNIISYVLIAFVSISLVVSSIMIGIITYISVLLTMLGGLISFENC